MSGASARSALGGPPKVRKLRAGDLAAVVELDALLTGERKQAYWRDVFERFLGDERRIGLACAGAAGRLEGFLFGEVRAFEFGSEACGWIFAVGVDPQSSRTGIGTALLARAKERFGALGVSSVRTMVRRQDVPLLAFFRGQGFVGGPFVQLESELGGEGTP
jgi:ribosomal protein S18 acetylase RimI-like enzyme